MAVLRIANQTPTHLSIDKLKYYTAHALYMATAVSMTCDGLKAIAKVTKSSIETFKYFKEAPAGIKSIDAVASNFTSAFNFLEPAILIYDCVIGDKTGKRPWEQAKTTKKVTWVIKRIKGGTKFAKLMHSSELISISVALTPIAIAKLVLDFIGSSIKLVDRGIAWNDSRLQCEKFSRRIEKWELRKINHERELDTCNDKLESLDARVKSELKTRRMHAFKTACAVGLLVLTILGFVALISQLPFLNLALIGIGLGSNMAKSYKVGLNLFAKWMAKPTEAQIAAAAAAAA